MRNKIHLSDAVLTGINIDELLTAVICNERQINEVTLLKTLSSLLHERVSEAYEEFDFIKSDLLFQAINEQHHIAIDMLKSDSHDK